MQLLAFFLTAALIEPAAARQPVVGPPSAAQQSPPQAEPNQVDALVSISRVRAALEKLSTKPATLRGLYDRPVFRVEIQERQRMVDLIQSLDLSSGPPVPGGLYGHEQMRLLFPRVSYPANAVQPLIAVDLLALRRTVAKGVSNARHSLAEEGAREEVRREIAAYCGRQPESGSGIQLCTSAPVIR